ncbi:MAG: lipocalin-like domain-containing protein [Muribaculaceae bacterium]|nr:lipocalin-like domain-containing protein [Muribaculaceae bacterium]
MKKTTLYLLSLMAVLLLSACTRNHGDIGIWFGTWHVEQITAGGTPVNVEGDYFFQFQNKVFRVSQVYGHEQLVESFGSWEEDETSNKMTIDFLDPTVYYIVMPGLEVHNEFTITHTSSKEITFTKTDAAGTTFAYHLKKQP